jgi:hypothetical protein
MDEMALRRSGWIHNQALCYQVTAKVRVRVRLRQKFGVLIGVPGCGMAGDEAAKEIRSMPARGITPALSRWVTRMGCKVNAVEAVCDGLRRSTGVHMCVDRQLTASRMRSTISGLASVETSPGS